MSYRGSSGLRRATQLVAIGIWVTSTLLTLETLGGETGICTPDGGCEILLSTPFSRVSGLPISIFPFLASLLYLVGSMREEPILRRIAVSAFIPMLLLGLLLTYISIKDYGTLCPLCEATKALIASLLTIEYLDMRMEKKGVGWLEPAHKADRPRNPDRSIHNVHVDNCLHESRVDPHKPPQNSVVW